MWNNMRGVVMMRMETYPGGQIPGHPGVIAEHLALAKDLYDGLWYNQLERTDGI
jgi:hypothetical protein